MVPVHQAGPRRRWLLCLAWAWALGAVVSAGPAWGQDDDFNDNVTGPQWTTVVDEPQTLSVFEFSERLNVIANSPPSLSTDALYLSNGPSGFRMSTAADFELALDYAFNGFDGERADDGDALTLVFGVGRDEAGTDSAAVGYGAAAQEVLGTTVISEVLVGAARTNNAQTQELLGLGGPSTGTFSITYDASADDLRLGVGGNEMLLDDVVQGEWNADSLLVSFGARGSAFFLLSGDAWLDNFQIVSGDVLPIGGLAGDYNGGGQVEQGDLDLVLQNWGRNTELTGVPAGWVNDEPTELIDQEELDGVLLGWGNTAAPRLAGAAVPEPGMAWCLAFGLSVLRRRSAFGR